MLSNVDLLYLQRLTYVKFSPTRHLLYLFAGSLFLPFIIVQSCNRRLNRLYQDSGIQVCIISALLSCPRFCFNIEPVIENADMFLSSLIVSALDEFWTNLFFMASVFYSSRVNICCQRCCIKFVCIMASQEVISPEIVDQKAVI
jgi:hypothetical protein